MRPVAPERFEYARLRVPDLDHAVRFYERNVGLEIVARDERTTLLRAGLSHHSIELEHDASLEEAVVDAVGWAMPDRAAFDALAERAQAAGLGPKPLRESTAAGCMDGFAVDDVHGLTWEFVLEPFVFAEPPFLAFTPERLMHPFVVTDRYEEMMRFATEVVGFLASDHIADYTTFLRGENRYHHCLALLKDDTYSFNHINFLMPSFDHVMKGRGRALYDGVPISCDLVNHSASGTWAFYMHDTRCGPQIELSHGHRVFTSEEHETHRPRRLAPGARTEIDLWRAADDQWT